MRFHDLRREVRDERLEKGWERCDLELEDGLCWNIEVMAREEVLGRGLVDEVE